MPWRYAAFATTAGEVGTAFLPACAITVNGALNRYAPRVKSIFASGSNLLLEMSVGALGRALLPFARPVRTLDALHLATMDFLRSQGLMPSLATYDERLAAAAVGEGFALAAC